MNQNRTALLTKSYVRLRSFVAFPFWAIAAVVSIPPLAILYWTDKAMTWAEKTIPEAFDGDDDAD